MLAGFAGCGNSSTPFNSTADTAGGSLPPQPPSGVSDYAAATPVPETQTEQAQAFNTESYDHFVDNPFLATRSNPLSTFSIDVDTASYSIVRRYLSQRQRPPAGAVRIEELINYFNYRYPQPKQDVPFSVNVELSDCPWNKGHKLARIGLKGREVAAEQRPVSNLVFLLDVSGSMHDANKLPLVKSAMGLMLEQLTENDRISIVVYAGAAGMVLPPTGAHHKSRIMSAMNQLNAGGSTNGGEGIELAYNIAMEHFIPGGINRVILCTDGDFNVGSSSHSQLIPLIQAKARSGVFLSVLGFGMGNLNDSLMEKLADKGNGNYAYIDTLSEAQKVLVDQISGTLVTIAKDVKIQVDFNSARVQSYRLIGYENRRLRSEDFQDDSKDAGEIGAGHTVTALYDIVPVGQESDLPTVTPSKYQQAPAASAAADSDELLTVRLRYKQPDGQHSRELKMPVVDVERSFVQASQDLQFAAAVAAFGMLLRDSQHKGTATWDDVIDIARKNVGDDPHGYRREFISLAEQARESAPRQVALQR